MSKSRASVLIELFKLVEDIGLDALKSDLAGNLKKVGFTSQEIDNIVKEAPSFIAGEDEWTTFLKKAGLVDLAKAVTRNRMNYSAGNYTRQSLDRNAQKLKDLAHFMVKLKHEV